jgi:large subunit ribosomal protein L1
MAKTKAVLLEEAKNLGIEIDSSSKVSEIQAAIDSHAAVTAEVAPVTDANNEEVLEPETAKAGKRSAKSLKEATQKQEKEERKLSSEDSSDKPTTPLKHARTRLERRGKQFRKNAEQIDKSKTYSLDEAIELAKKTSHVKFDATVELHINLGVDPRQADQNIRDTLVLPSGSGKKVKIAVLTDDPASAKTAGADMAGTDELLAEFDKGKTDFDVLIATPLLMPRLGKYARVLGPRGLMPNPKSGTVTTDISRAVAEAKAGKVEYRVDSTGIVHLGVGKVSFTNTQLADNLQAVLTSIRNNKPSGIKGNYIKSVHITTSMGPSLSVEISSAV